MKKRTKLACLILAMMTAVTPLAMAGCGGDTESETVIEDTVDDAAVEAKAEVPKDMKSEKVELSEDTYITTPGTEDLSVAEDGCSIYVNNVLYVYAERNTPEKDVEALAKKYGAEIVGASNALDIYQLQFEKAMTMDALTNLMAELEKEDCVEMADMDYLMEANESYMPNDPWYDSDEGENDKEKNQWAIKAINAEKAWDYLDYMQKVNVAVVEVDVYKGHEDLNVKLELDPTAVTKFVAAKEKADHGTHVAGTMAAIADNGIGISGVCAIPDTEIYVCHNHNKITVKNAVFGLSELITKHDVKVINISQYSNPEAAIISASHGNKKARNAIEDQARRAVEPLKRLLDDGHEFVIVVAAGNQNAKKCWKSFLDQDAYGYTLSKSLAYDKDNSISGADAKYAYYLNAIEDKELKDRIIVVGSVGLFEADKAKEYNKDKQSLMDAALTEEKLQELIAEAKKEGTESLYYAASYSNTGDRVDIMAPGINIYSCSTDNKYFLTKSGGTSMAAPHVSGTAAMVFGCNPDLTGAEVKDILLQTADYDRSFDDVDAGMLRTDRAVEYVLKTGEYSKEKRKGIINFMGMTYEEMMPNVDELYFTETMDEPGVWYATGYYEDKASLNFKLTGADSVGGCKPVSMTVSALNDEEVRITEDIELGMEYYEAEMLDNVTTLRQDSDWIVLQQKKGEYAITMTFDVHGLESVLKTVTIDRA